MRWVFGAATLLGLFSTLQAYRLTVLTSKDPMNIEVGSLLALNFAYWFIPAGFSPIIFALIRRFPIDEHRLKAIGVHAAAAVAFTAIHATGMMIMRGILWGPPMIGWSLALQQTYLRNLDWLLMTYTTVVGFTYALGYYREVQARSVREAQLQTRLVEARLKTLQAELHPHFLFNTLHAISALVHTNPDSADRMISRLFQGLEGLKRPSVIVFYGDHVPTLPSLANPFPDTSTDYFVAACRDGLWLKGTARDLFLHELADMSLEAFSKVRSDSHGT